ncbi:hypothetical protein TRFO_30219 [Tritrichomonas foetus]|uniref:Uncharacterized protein n=1 Tax=Tritrichomonas foetus TaxID=1144522 RepID=A0A1J4JYJ0_9EUKA|nr:hypothetical protein TRFO_30219 [Tritrichomonas foetus]|eukprot:OHT02566.1 hypothetical protein TRFO_30219 [Tritrichomonas foetus]
MIFLLFSFGFSTRNHHRKRSHDQNIAITAALSAMQVAGPLLVGSGGGSAGDDSEGGGGGLLGAATGMMKESKEEQKELDAKELEAKKAAMESSQKTIDKLYESFQSSIIPDEEFKVKSKAPKYSHPPIVSMTKIFKPISDFDPSICNKKKKCIDCQKKKENSVKRHKKEKYTDEDLAMRILLFKLICLL